MDVLVRVCDTKPVTHDVQEADVGRWLWIPRFTWSGLLLIKIADVKLGFVVAELEYCIERWVAEKAALINDALGNQFARLYCPKKTHSKARGNFAFRDINHMDRNTRH